MEKKLIEHGYNLYRPVLENGKIDLIAEKNGVFLRIQIKTLTPGGYKGAHVIPVRKISHNMGEYKIKRYTKKDIDYFIGVDLYTEDVYILPVEFSSQYASSISLNYCTQYKNNFDQLELVVGNDNDEGDDNVECLTDNADVNDVGMEETSRERVDNRPPKQKCMVKTYSSLQTEMA